MKEKTARYFTSCNLTKLTNDKVYTERMETFGIDEIPWRIDENSIKKWNINDVEEEAMEAVSNYLQILLNNSTLELPESRHSYELGESGKLKRRLHILHDSICLWRSQKYLQRTFGEKVVSLQSLIHDSRSVGMQTNDGDTPLMSDSMEVDTPSVETLANAWGFEVVEMKGDGNCFFFAIAFQIPKLKEENKMSKFLIDFLGSIGISFDAPVRELADTPRALIVEWTGPFLEDYQQFFDGLNIQQEAADF